MEIASPPLQILAESIASPAAIALTSASAIGAAGLALLMQPGRKGLRIAGTVVALAGFAMLLVEVIKRAATGDDGASTSLPPVFPVIFAFIALAGAVRMVTHPKPVFAALYFILVVIATAGMFLLLGAEFMAFSLVIVYAGAILITYMFVLMLAQQSPVEGVGDAWYDRVPREAVSAVVVGFVILATLSDAFFSPRSQTQLADARANGESAAIERAWERLEEMPKLLLETTRTAHADQWRAANREGKTTGAGANMPEIVAIERKPDGSALRRIDGGVSVSAKLADGSTIAVAIPDELRPDNSRQVGVDLVSKFPAGLEIAGVVLLMALFGAVILARKQIELGEDERRSLAGMRRITVDGEAGGMR
ncbi:MAG: NADH-quinone oxidoreductase subunit J [bacterium]